MIGLLRWALLLSCLGLLASAQPAEQPLRILVFGDSLTRGYGLDNPLREAYPARLEEKLHQSSYHATVVASGVSGETTAGGRARIGWVLQAPQNWEDADPYRVDILILALGGNDGLRGLPIEATKENLHAIIEQSRERYPEIQILLAGVEMPRNLGEPYIGAFQSLFEEVAREAQVSWLPSILEGIGTNRELMQSDRIHPNARGHQAMADLVWDKLEPMLQKETPPRSSEAGLQK